MRAFVRLLALATASVTSLLPGATTIPSSANGLVLVLLRTDSRTAISMARSYDGYAWELTQGGANFPLQCDAASSVCTTTIPAEGTYSIEAYLAAGLGTLQQASSRLLTQATFGPTRSDVSALSSSMQVAGDPAAAVRNWVQAQMAVNATLHRVYYRERVNTRTATPSATGGVHSACAAGSRWHRFALTKSDTRKDVVFAAGGALGITMSVDGSVRTEVETGSSAAPGALGTYTICYVEERVDGVVWLRSGSGKTDCKFSTVERRANPPIHFGGAPDTSVTHVLDPSSAIDSAAKLVPFAEAPVHNASLLEGALECTDQLRAQPHSFLRTQDGAYHRHDPRVVMLTNTLSQPAHEALTSSTASDGSSSRCSMRSRSRRRPRRARTRSPATPRSSTRRARRPTSSAPRTASSG